VLFEVDGSNDQFDRASSKPDPPKVFAMAMNKGALTGTNLAFSTRSSALDWTLDVPEAGADCMVSFEERTCPNGQMSSPAAVGWLQARTQRASNDRLERDGGMFRDDLNAPSLEKYLWAGNAPYAVKDCGKALKSQEMSAPSERTINPRLALPRRPSGAHSTMKAVEVPHSPPAG
jgi:hypothetical protein